MNMNNFKIRDYFHTYRISGKEFDRLSKKADKHQSKMLSYMASL